MKKILTLFFALVLCSCMCFGATVYAEESLGTYTDISNGATITFNTDTDIGADLVHYLNLSENYSGTKYYTIRDNSFTESSDGSADVSLKGEGNGEFELKYVGKLKEIKSTIIKIGENATINLVYGGVKEETKTDDNNVTVTIESDNTTIIQSGANNVAVLGVSSLIDLTGEKDSADAPAGTATRTPDKKDDFPIVLVIVLILIVIVGALAVMYFTLPAFKEKVDNLLGKNKKRSTKRR